MTPLIIHPQEWRRVASMDIGRILPGIAILSGQIFVCGGEVDSKILANGEVCICTIL